MKREDVATLIQAFRLRSVVPPVGQRHVYVWGDELPALQGLLGRLPVVMLDLHQLTSRLTRHPRNLAAARSVLEQEICGELHATPAPAGANRVLVVIGCDLLMRYRVPLASFIQCADDRTMLFLVAPLARLKHESLPEYVEFRPTATLDYLAGFAPEVALVE